MKNKKSKIDIIDRVYRDNPQYQLKDVNAIVNLFLDYLYDDLKNGTSVEMRGFGSFDFIVKHGRENARNPRTGETVKCNDRIKIRFKPGYELKKALLDIPIDKYYED